MKQRQYLVTLNVPTALEEGLVDCLLTLELEEGFSSYVVSGHDHKNQGLSLAEQVSGRQKRIRFQLYIPEKGLDVLLAKLKREFAGAGIHYWVLPVTESGYI